MSFERVFAQTVSRILEAKDRSEFKKPLDLKTWKGPKKQKLVLYLA